MTVRFINCFRLPAAFVLCLNATPSLANKGALHDLQAYQIELLLIARGMLVSPGIVQALVEYFRPTLNSRDTDLDDLVQELNEDYIHNLEVLFVEAPFGTEITDPVSAPCMIENAEPTYIESSESWDLDFVYQTTTTRRTRSQGGPSSQPKKERDEKCVIS